MADVVVGVVGARGSLGRLITAALESDGAQAIAVDVRRSGPSERAGLLGTLDALVFGAPIRDAGLHREALASGCHVVDVAVLQSPTGTAGDHGTREMLDLLTGADVAYRDRPVQATGGTIGRMRLFDLPVAEPELSGLGMGLELVTGFGQASMHAQLRALQIVRSRVRAAYAPARDRAARRKSQTPGTSEQTQLSAVALDGAGQPVGGRLLTVSSDYGATAAVAAATATAAARGQLAGGAGHLRRFLTLPGLLELPLVEAVIDADTGPLATPK